MESNYPQQLKDHVKKKIISKAAPGEIFPRVQPFILVKTKIPIIHDILTINITLQLNICNIHVLKIV